MPRNLRVTGIGGGLYDAVISSLGMKDAIKGKSIVEPLDHELPTPAAH